MSKSILVPENSVMVGVKKHKVIVTDEKLVHIHHNKDCQNPCEVTKEIMWYLERELFVQDGYAVADVF